MVVEALVALAVQCSTTQLLELWNVLLRGAIENVARGLPITAQMHAAFKNRLVGGFKLAGIRLELLPQALGHYALLRDSLPHELCSGAFPVFGICTGPGR